MARIHPFKAYKPESETVTEVASPPYDVVSTQEARELARGNPRSFLHVVRPEIDLPEGTPFDDDRVYEKGAENLRTFMEEGTLKKDPDRALYLYRLTRNGRSQAGIFPCVSVEEYDRDRICRHELTRPDKEDDRTRHILSQSAHAEPVMLTMKPDSDVSRLMEKAMNGMEAEFDFRAGDGVRHTLWKVTDTAPWEKAFGNIPRLYIADGHHRCKSASRAAAHLRERNPSHTGEEEYNFFPAVIFPMDQMEILPYNRLIHRVPDTFWEQLQKQFDVEKRGKPSPERKGRVSLYRGEEWWSLELPLDEEPDSVEKLDVYRLQKHILEPMLGITDPRRDSNISFVGGIRGTGELEQQVDSGEAQLAVSMYPTAVEELVKVAEEGKLMPPKSTWFEPKLRSGLLVHRF